MSYSIVPEALPNGLVPVRRTLPKMLCCKCGVEIESNPANMCMPCLQSEVDITAGIGKEVILHQCRGCERYLRPPWCACERESAQLLAVCLKRIPGLSRVHLVDASFIWTEPHSRRLKVKLTVQKEVLRGARVEQSFPVEFILANQQCDACARSYTDHVWRALVQTRQRVDHKRTFFLLEQLILRYRAHEKCISVEQVPNGVDFAFSERSHALKFMDFLATVVPVRSKAAKQLISEDVHEGTKNYKFSYAVELVPLCRDDLVVLPARTAATLGAINPLVLVQRVSNHVFFIDPRTLQLAEMNAERYWHDPFRALLSQERLEEFTVLDVTPVTIAPLTGAALRRKQKQRKGKAGSEDGTATIASASGKRRRSSGGTDDVDDATSTQGASSIAGGRASRAGGFTGAVSLAGGSIAFHGASSVASTVTGGFKGRMLLADVEVMKTRDMGSSDQRYLVRTHLGNILRPGDLAMGYDLTNAVYNDMDAEATATGGRSRTKGTAGRAGRFDMPDIVLVRKAYPKRGERAVIDVDMASTVTSRAGRRAAARAAAAKVEGEVEMGEEPGARASAAAPRERIWKLRRFDDVVPTTHSDVVRKGDEERVAAQFEQFLQDIENDPVLRKNINLYKNQAAIEQRAAAAAARSVTLSVPAASSDAPAATLPAAEGTGSDDEAEDGGDGGIDLAELLDDITLDGAAAASAHIDPDDESAVAASALRDSTASAAEEDGDGGGAVEEEEWQHPSPKRSAKRAALEASASAIPEGDEGADDDDDDL